MNNKKLSRETQDKVESPAGLAFIVYIHHSVGRKNVQIKLRRILQSSRAEPYMAECFSVPKAVNNPPTSTISFGRAEEGVWEKATVHKVATRDLGVILQTTTKLVASASVQHVRTSYHSVE
jgi:hypothetical protein